MKQMYHFFDDADGLSWEIGYLKIVKTHNFPPYWLFDRVVDWSESLKIYFSLVA